MIEAFRIVRERVPDAQLVLAGSMATDDPEGFRVWDDTEAARAGDRDIYLLSNLHQVGSVQINAFQRVADVVAAEVAARGLRPHRERGALEGPARDRRPRRRASSCRSATATTATSSTRSRSARSAPSTCSPTRSAPTRSARRAASTCASNFLSTRELEDWLTAVRDAARSDARHAPRAVPVLGATTTDRSRRTRGAGGLVERAAPAGRARRHRRRGRRGSRPRIDDDDRAAVAAGAATVPGLDLHLARPRSRVCTACTTTSSRTRCCGSSTTGCSTSPAGPASTVTSREAWDGYVAVNAAFADAVVRSARRAASTVLVHDYHLALVPGMVRGGPARPAAHRTSPTRRSAGPTRSGCCPPTWPRRCARRWARCRRVPHRTVGRGVHGVGARGARDATSPTARTPRRSAPIPTPSPSSRRRDGTCAAAVELDELVGDRKLMFRSDRIDLSKNIVRGFHVYDAAARRRTPSGASGWCSSPCSTGRARTWPSTSRTSRRSTRRRPG